MLALPFEIWQDIPGWEYHKVSSMGHVKSIDRIITRSNGRKQTIHGKIIEGRVSIDKHGYPRHQVSISVGKNRTVKLTTARLVAMAFIANPDNLPEVNHKDENPLNNQISNLEWCTHRYNVNYGTRTERASKKTRKSIIQLTLSGDVVRIWESQQEIQRTTNYPYQSISGCCRGKQKTAYGYKWQYYEEGK